MSILSTNEKNNKSMIPKELKKQKSRCIELRHTAKNQYVVSPNRKTNADQFDRKSAANHHRHRRRRHHHCRT